MNHPDPDPIDEREWQAQEQALQALRTRAPAAVDDHHYREIAEAIASAPRGMPPAGFAAAVVAELAGRQQRHRRWTTLGFSLVAAAVVVASGAFSVSAWQALHSAIGSETTAWLTALAGMAALSWLCRQALAMIEADRGHKPAS